MDRLQKHNLKNIKRFFEQKTGMSLAQQPAYIRRNPLKPALLTAVMSVFCLVLVAFTYPLFSPLDGDALSLSSLYEGNGIVTITVENRSHKKLEFEPQVRLYHWITGEEVPVLSDDILFDGTSISPHSTETMTIDLSGAYNIEDLEDSMEKDWYYLLLTNYNFVFGQEWKCSVFFGQDTEKIESPNEPFFSLDPVVLSHIEEELRFYFEDDYVGAFAGNPMNYEYLQKVDEYLLRCGKEIVPSVNPGIMVKPIPDGVILDETYPEEKQYTLAGQNQSIHDAFGKLVGATETENIQILQTWAPTEKGAEDGAWAVPVMFFATYEISAIESSEDCAFIHGQIVSFAELEPYKVYTDDFFVCYNITHLFYTDLRSYVEEIVSMNEATGIDYYFDEQVYRRIENIYNYYQENLEITSWNKFLDLRPDCLIERDQTSSELVRDGLLGYIKSESAIEKIVISISTEADRKEIYSFEIIPEDPYYYDLANAAEVTAFIQNLEEGVYVLNIEAWIDSDVMGYQDLSEQVFATGNATWPGLL